MFQTIADKLRNYLKVDIDENAKAQIESLTSKNKQLEKAQKENILTISNLQNEIKKYTKQSEGYAELYELGYEYTPSPECSSELEAKLKIAENNLATIVGYEHHYEIFNAYKLDGSTSKGEKMQNAYAKNLIIGFNAYVNTKEKAITEKNYQHTVELIEKAFDKFNKQGAMVGIRIDPSYKDGRLKILKLKLDIKLAKAKEHEAMKEEKHRLKEQEKLLAEAEKERKRLESERKAMNLAFEKELNKEEQEKIKEQLAEIDKRISDIDFRVSHPKAGWVYIIHSPSLQNMVKIGVSRRLSGPYERVRELSGSSLPEAFQIDGFCFSNDAFWLESSMHEYFKKQRVNPNKEFFYISAQEAIDVLQDKFKCEVHYVNESEENNEI